MATLFAVLLIIFQVYTINCCAATKARIAGDASGNLVIETPDGTEGKILVNGIDLLGELNIFRRAAKLVCRETSNFFDKIDLDGNGGGDFKWIGAVLASNGKIYTSPDNKDSILIIDPRTNAVTFQGVKEKGVDDAQKPIFKDVVENYKHELYFTPHKFNGFLKINLNDDSHEVIDGIPDFREFGWSGAVLDASKMKIYLMPWIVQSVLVFDTEDRSTRHIQFQWGAPKPSWSGGVLAAERFIYSIPAEADFVLEIDTRDDSVKEIELGVNVQDITRRDTGDNKWLWYGGVLAPNGDVIGTPFASSTVLIIRPGTNPGSATVSIVPLRAEPPQIATWYRSTLVQDRYVIAMPGQGTNMLILDLEKLQNDEPYTTLLEIPNLGFSDGNNPLFSNAVITPDNILYGIPFASEDVVTTDLSIVAFCNE
eukprot:gene5287-7059_t